MKKILSIIFEVLLFVIHIVSIIFSLCFIFIEFRYLFAGDWLIHNNLILGFIKSLFKALLALFAFVVILIEFINLKKKNNTLKYYLFVCNISLLLMSIIIMIFASNYVGLICFSLSIIIILFKVLLYFIRHKKNG